MACIGKVYLHYYAKGMLLKNYSATFGLETGGFCTVNGPVFLLK